MSNQFISSSGLCWGTREEKKVVMKTYRVFRKLGAGGTFCAAGGFSCGGAGPWARLGLDSLEESSVSSSYTREREIYIWAVSDASILVMSTANNW